MIEIMSRESFNVAWFIEPKQGVIKQIKAVKIKIANRWFFYFEESEDTEQGQVTGYNITDMETGMVAHRDLSLNYAIECVREKVIKYPEKFEEGKEILKQHNFNFPINKIPNE